MAARRDRGQGHQGDPLIQCYITDRRSLPSGETLLSAIERTLDQFHSLSGADALVRSPASWQGFVRGSVARPGVARGSGDPPHPYGNHEAVPSDGPDWIQIREKDLSARELFELTRSILALPNPRAVKILINSRIDVALAAGAAGAHLPSGSLAPKKWQSITPPGFLMGVSCHSLVEVRMAEEDGASYVVFGPVFPPLSKPSPLPAVGLADLARAAAAVKIPVLALGGVTRANATACVEAGASGVAGISLFQASLFQAP